MGACSSGGKGALSSQGKWAIATLQQAVNKRTDSELMTIYKLYGNANLAKLTNEEKMVRAVAIDELLERGKLYDDRSTGEIFKASPNETFVRHNDKSYKITKMWTVENEDGKSHKMVEAQTLVNGKWGAVQGYDLRKTLAKKARQVK